MALKPLKYYLWTGLSPCYLGDECAVLTVQAGRQDVSVIEEEVWVLQHHCLSRRWMQGLNICMCAQALTVVLYLRCEMQGQRLQCIKERFSLAWCSLIYIYI